MRWRGRWKGGVGCGVGVGVTISGKSQRTINLSATDRHLTVHETPPVKTHTTSETFFTVPTFSPTNAGCAFRTLAGRFVSL